MSIGAVFFDLGGVILRTEYQAPREHLAERLNMDYEDLVKLVFESDSGRKASLGALSVDEHWAAVVRKLGRPISEAKAIRDEFFAGDILDRGLIDFIRSLRSRRKTGIITNAWGDMRAYITEQKIGDAFDELVISAEVGLIKPDARIYQLALEKLNVKAEETAFLDDTPANVEAARDTGMRGILFDDPGEALAELKLLLKTK